MIHLATLASLLMLMTAGVADAKCSDEIKALQGKAASTDAANKPGAQKETGDPQSTAGVEGGGTKSVSAKILEAKAYDQKGDEANCMKAVNEAKAATDMK